MAANVRRQENISFVQVKAKIDLSGITKIATSKYSIDTFVELPKSDSVVKKGTGADVTVYTFLGKDDIRLYSADEFKKDILDITRQSKPATLTAVSFGMINAINLVGHTAHAIHSNHDIGEV